MRKILSCATILSVTILFVVACDTPSKTTQLYQIRKATIVDGRLLIRTVGKTPGRDDNYSIDTRQAEVIIQDLPGGTYVKFYLSLGKSDYPRCTVYVHTQEQQLTWEGALQTGSNFYIPGDVIPEIHNTK
ncbi:MAG: hypothetical protein Q7S28_00255 [bacterium]|nr:hypothetical protein [bacterium]